MQPLQSYKMQYEDFSVVTFRPAMAKGQCSFGLRKVEDLEEEIGFGVGVISRSAVCRPPHLPSQSGVDLVLIMPHRQLVIFCHST